MSELDRLWRAAGEDWRARLVYADALEEGGDEAEAAHHREVAGRQRAAEREELLAGYRWFRGQGESASSSLSLARAEEMARRAGLQFRWEYDPDTEGYLSTEADRVEACFCYGPDLGMPLGSICGVADADTDFRRFIEAELALEVLGRNHKGGRSR